MQKDKSRNGGVLYENKVKRTIRYVLEHIESPIAICEDKSCGKFNSYDTDLKLLIKGHQTNFELKSQDAQMGETSFRYDPYETCPFMPVKEVANDFFELLLEEALLPLSPDLDNLMAYLRSLDPFDYHQNVVAFPINVTKDAWNQAVANGMTVPIRKNVPYNEQAISAHYNGKADPVYYIQIENQGLFYMGENPLDLPVPKLEGNVTLEIRLKRCGSRQHKGLGVPVTRANIITSSRLDPNIYSPVNLDDPYDIEHFFQRIS